MNEDYYGNPKDWDKKDKTKKLKFTDFASILLLLLIFASAYIVTIEIDNIKESEYNKGILEGGNIVVLTLANQLASCPLNGVPLIVNNKTMNIFAIECLQGGG